MCAGLSLRLSTARISAAPLPAAPQEDMAVLGVTVWLPMHSSHIKLSDPVIQRLPDLAAVISLTCKILSLRGAWLWLPSLAELST